MLFTDVTKLVPRLREHLLELLLDLSADDWSTGTSCPGWSVHDVATHLLGIDVGNLAARRDRWVPDLAPADESDAWLDYYSGQWVLAARRLSPELLNELLAGVGAAFDGYITGLDLHATGGPVGRATSAEPAPVWLDVAREYMERFVHQQQIRDAVGRPALPPELLAPVLVTAAHAPRSRCARTPAPPERSSGSSPQGRAVARGTSSLTTGPGHCRCRLLRPPRPAQRVQLHATP